MFTFTNMTPKQNLSKHDFKTGKPKPVSNNDDIDKYTIQLPYGGPPRVKTRVEKFFELPIPLKVSYLSLFILFIFPTLVMLFLFVVGNFSTITVNPEGVEYYEIYMNALSIIRIVGICISGLTLSIYTLWKSK